VRRHELGGPLRGDAHHRADVVLVDHLVEGDRADHHCGARLLGRRDRDLELLERRLGLDDDAVGSALHERPRLLLEGAELCASDHVNAGDGASQSNEGTTAFSATAVEATRRSMVGFKGDQSETISVNPDMLILPINLEEQGYEIINSKGKVDVATNNVNFHQGRYKMLVVPNFLTDTNNWFMVDSDLMKKDLWWFDRIPLEFMQDKDSDTLLAKYLGYMRYGFGWIDWRFIFGHLVA